MGLVEVEDMRAEPTMLGHRISVDNRAAEIFNMLDLDNNGELTMEEFVNGYLRYNLKICEKCIMYHTRSCAFRIAQY